MFNQKPSLALTSILGDIKKNILGTTDFNMKLSNMRKEQDFCVYPLQKGDDWVNITIQSDTRIGKLNLLTGKGIMSKSYPNGAYFLHLSIGQTDTFEMSENDVQKLKEHIKGTASPNAGNAGITCDNSEAKMTSL